MTPLLDYQPNPINPTAILSPFPLQVLPSNFRCITGVDFTYHHHLYRSVDRWIKSILPLLQLHVSSWFVNILSNMLIVNYWAFYRNASISSFSIFFITFRLAHCFVSNTLHPIYWKIILSKTFYSTIIFPFHSVFHLLRNITHYSVPTSPFKVTSPYWLFYFHCIFIFCINSTFLDDSCRWHFFLYYSQLSIAKFATVSAHMYFFFGVFVPVRIYISLQHFFPPIYYSPQDIVLLSVHIPLPISLPPHYLTVQQIIPSSACCDISLYIIFIFWLRFLVSYFWRRLMMYLLKTKGFFSFLVKLFKAKLTNRK